MKQAVHQVNNRIDFHQGNILIIKDNDLFLFKLDKFTFIFKLLNFILIKILFSM